MKKFGAMLGDQVEVGCNSVLNPGTVVGRGSHVYPLSMMRGFLPSGMIHKTRGKPFRCRGGTEPFGNDLVGKGEKPWNSSWNFCNRGVAHRAADCADLGAAAGAVRGVAVLHSFKKGQRRRDPVIMLVDEASGARFPVLYWENSIGRSKSCDIYLPDATASRDHAVLLRRDEGWFICDTGSKSGVYVNGRKIDGRKLLNIGDKVTMGSTTLVLRNTDERPLERRRALPGFPGSGIPIKLMLTATFTLLLVALQGAFLGGEFHPEQLIPFGRCSSWAGAVYLLHRRDAPGQL